MLVIFFSCLNIFHYLETVVQWKYSMSHKHEPNMKFKNF